MGKPPVLNDEQIYNIGKRFYKNFSVSDKLPELPEFLIAQRDADLKWFKELCAHCDTPLLRKGKR